MGELITAVEAVTGSTEADEDGTEASEIHKLADIFKFDDENPFFKQQVENLPLEDDKLKAAFLPGGALHKRTKLVTLVATNERSNSFLVKGPVGKPVKIQLFLNEQWAGELLAAVRKVTETTPGSESLNVNGVSTAAAVEPQKVQPAVSFWACCTQPSVD